MFLRRSFFLLFMVSCVLGGARDFYQEDGPPLACLPHPPLGLSVVSLVRVSTLYSSFNGCCLVSYLTYNLLLLRQPCFFRFAVGLNSNDRSIIMFPLLPLPSYLFTFSLLFCTVDFYFPLQLKVINTVSVAVSFFLLVRNVSVSEHFGVPFRGCTIHI